MRWSGRKSRGLIGVDIGSRSIKAVQVARGGSGAQVTAALTIPRMEHGGALDREEVQRLAQVLHRQGFEGSEIVVSAPGDSLLVGTLSLPPRSSGAPVDQIARMELARMHKYDPSAFELVHWELPASAPMTGHGNKSGTTSVMAAACPHAEALSLIDLFESAQLEVVGIDVPWLALARATGSLWKTDTQTQGNPLESPAAVIVGILDIGWRGARVLVVRNEVIVFERVLTEGGIGKLHDALKKKLQLDDQATDYLMRDVGCASLRNAPVDGDRRESTEEDVFKEPRRMITAHFDALRDEMQISLNYAVQQVRGDGIHRLILAGGGGALPQLAENLQAAFNFDVVSADVTKLATCPQGLDRLCGSTTLTTALGLAMYEA